MIIQEDITFLSDRLVKYGVDVSKLSNNSLAVINELCRVTWKLTEDTIKSISNYFMINSKYSKYIELKHIREVHSPIRKCIYNLDIKYILETLNNETEQSKINKALNQIICLVYIQDLASSLSDNKTIHILNFGLKRFWAKDILKILGDSTGDIDLNKLIYLFKLIAIHMTNGLVPKDIYNVREKLEDCYITLNKLRKKNIKSYVKKAQLLSAYDEQYNLAISIEFIASMLYIRLNIEDIDNGTLKRVMDILNNYGLNSKEFKDYTNRIKSKSIRKLAIELRNNYKYITKEIMTDEELIQKDKLELAAINYAIKTGKFTPYYITVIN